MPSARPDRQWAESVGPSFLEEDSNGWLVTFSDLVLQLFAFVLVAAVLAPGAASAPRTVTARPRAPIDAPRPRAQIAAPAFAIESATEPDALSRARFDDLPPPLPVASTAAEKPPPPLVAEAPPVTSLASELEASLAEAGLADVVQVAVNGGGVTLSISDTIGFASDSAELLPDAAPVLAAVRRLVGVRSELAVEVAGHTDDAPVHGGAFGSNLELSLARAARVARELAAGDAGLTGRIFAAGYGEQRPRVPNVDAKGRARNRRVEIRLVPHADAR